MSVVLIWALTSTIQRSPPNFKPTPSNNHHSVTVANLLDTISITQNTTTAVVIPEKPKAESRSVPISAKARGPLFLMLLSSWRLSLNLLMEKKLSQAKNASQTKTKNKLPKRELTNIDFMDLNDVKAAHVQSNTNGKDLTDPIDILCAVLTSYTIAKLKAM